MSTGLALTRVWDHGWSNDCEVSDVPKTLFDAKRNPRLTLIEPEHRAADYVSAQNARAVLALVDMVVEDDDLELVYED